MTINLKTDFAYQNAKATLKKPVIRMTIMKRQTVRMKKPLPKICGNIIPVR